MERKEWNSTLDKYLLTNTMTSDQYASLNDIQMAIIQELKKSFKRIKNENNQEL